MKNEISLKEFEKNSDISYYNWHDLFVNSNTKKFIDKEIIAELIYDDTEKNLWDDELIKLMFEWEFDSISRLKWIKITLVKNSLKDKITNWEKIYIVD